MYKYINKKEEIEKLSNITYKLLNETSNINEKTLNNIQKLREETDLMRFKPMLPQKNFEQEQKWIWPCVGKIVGEYNEPRATHIHNGIDIAVPVGTPVRAVADGKVYYAGNNDPKGYGNYVIIEHYVNGKIITSEYGHLSSWNVYKGQWVTQGQIIAKSGNTGHSEGPHVHFTIREGVYRGMHVNPYKYINPR